MTPYSSMWYYGWDCALYHSGLKAIFGNRKNYIRYIITTELRERDAWLLSMGCRIPYGI